MVCCQASVKTWAIEDILGSDASTILAKAWVDVQSVMKHGGWRDKLLDEQLINSKK